MIWYNNESELKEALMRKLAILKTSLIFMMILTLSVPASSKEKAVVSNWTAASLNVDGSYDEWGDDILNSEQKMSVDYAFRNDGENLFILFIFKDPKYLSTINAKGMTIWFNTEGKKKKKYGITFIKKRISADAFISVLEQQKGALSEGEKNNIRTNPYYFLHNTKVINKDSKSASQDARNREIKPAIFRSMRQNKMVVYEFAVPLKRVIENAPGIGTEPGKIIKVGFEWGGMTKEMIEALAKRRADAALRPERANRSGGSWSKASASGSARPGGGRNTKKYSFWVDVQLANLKVRSLYARSAFKRFFSSTALRISVQ